MKDLEELRRSVIERLEQRSNEAEGRAANPYWTHGHHTPMTWVARAYRTAARIVRESTPVASESARDYCRRVSSAVRDRRDDGSDFDDEAWFAGAIDEACAIISTTAHEIVEPHREGSGPVR